MPPVQHENSHTTEGLFNNTDDCTTLGVYLPQLLEHAVERFKDKVSVICGQDKLTYGELNGLANRFSRILVERGAGSGQLVGVALDRSVYLPVVLIAVLKSGAAYVPIDPTFPSQRIQQMIDDARPKIIITGRNVLESEPSSSGIERCQCLRLDELLQATKDPTDQSGKGYESNIEITIQGNDLAYIMYTSGSTGRPKGVEVTHESVANFLLSMQKQPGCSSEDRILAVTTISFDIAVLELFLPLICGGTVVMATREQVRDTAALVGLMEHHKITMMQGTPTLWQMLLDSGWQGLPRQLARILCGGEALSRLLADRLLTCAEVVWNMYGPTEATVWASIWDVSASKEMVLIGNPISNNRLYVLDDSLSPVGLSTPGELCIGGVGIARGYHNNSELTHSRFVKNPFHGGWMYRTGDLAQFLEPDKLSLMGRIDGQVKLRGHRIEVGDIEVAIMKREEISNTVVVCRDERLIAYCVLKMAITEPIDQMLRSWLAGLLPAYMVPSFFVKVESFPMTLNGKIDRNALLDPIMERSHNNTAIHPDTSAERLEHQICTIWSDVLGHGNFSVNDNFFEIGGDSGRLVRVQRDIERLLSLWIPVPKLFEFYTVRTLASYLSSDKTSGHIGTDAGASPSPNAFIPRNPYSSRDVSQDIAVISVACRLPGNITTPEEFWELLDRGGDAISEVPEDRGWDTEVGACNHVNLDKGDHASNVPSHCHQGGFITGINAYDTSFFGISPREARDLDPAQYLMLETCWEAFERAGYTRDQLRGSQTGVFMGTSNILAHQRFNPTATNNLLELDGFTVTGSSPATLSGRISYQMGLEGPAMTIDTACSSSLVTTHLACTALRQGECDLAMSGGVTLMLNPGLHVEFSRLGGMSSDGRCRSFSASANGTGWSEGAVVVILKRLSDALRDGDPVHAVIRGTAVNHDGRSATLTAPSGAAQQKLIRKALAMSNLLPDDIDYVEAHGTGTVLGDPIEAMALAEVFGSSDITSHSTKKGASSFAAEPLWIGSAKSNIGHTQAAAGLTGLLKVILTMQHKTLPQTLHVTEPTRSVDWQSANMSPVLVKRAWRSRRDGDLRRAGISAFSIGGTNAHIIVEEPTHHQKILESVDTTGDFVASSTLAFLISGDTHAALRMQCKKLHQYLVSERPFIDGHLELRNLAFSLATTRTHFRSRLALVASSKVELLDKLEDWIASDGDVFDSSSSAIGMCTVHTGVVPKLAMLFTGQGSQWPNMGNDLYQAFPVFREAVDQIASEFTELREPLLHAMWPGQGTSTSASLLGCTDFAQPAIFTLEVALWRLWQSWGVTPELVLGHSLGELAAAHVAGIMDLSDACRLVAARGRLMEAQGHVDKRMASVNASPAEVAVAAELLSAQDVDHGTVDVAAYNTPTQTVISGDCDAVKRITKYFADRGRKIKTLVEGHAFHSRHMDTMLAEYRGVAETVKFKHPHQKIGIISSVDGKLVETAQLQNAEYWVRQVRYPVRFSDSVQALAYDHGVNVYLELGPQPVLCGMGAECLANDEGQSASSVWLSSLVRNKDCVSNMQRTLAHLHVCGVSIDWLSYYRHFKCRRIPLPTYAFQREYLVPHLFPRPHVPLIVTRTSCDGIDGNNTTKDPNSQQSVDSDNIENFQFEIKWHSVKTSSTKPTGTWGVLIPASASNSWPTHVLSVLERTSLKLVQVKSLKDAEKLDGLLCLWDSHIDVVSQTQDYIGEALALLHTAAETQFNLPFIWITRHVVGTSTKADDRAMRLGMAPLWGLVRTSRTEHPELQLRLVDFGESEPSAETDGSIMVSALLLSGEPECAVRQNQVLVPRMKRVLNDSTMLKSPSLPGHQIQQLGPQLIRTDGAVLLTGGLGHIGAHIARWLVRDHGIRDLVLTSRRGMKVPGADTLIAELSGSGGGSSHVRVTVISGDIADADTVKSIMAMFTPDRPLRGVIHAAGVADSGVLSSMTPERCARTLSPKVNGAWYLHQATLELDDPSSLDLFILLSSISGVLGMAGLANYAAANTFLDALAHLRVARGLAATSLAYGTWGASDTENEEGGDGGMASRLARNTVSNLFNFGLDPLVPGQGLELLRKAAESTCALTIGAALDLNRLRSYCEEQDDGKVPPLLQSLLVVDRGQARQRITTQTPTSGRDELYEALNLADPGQQPEIVLDMVRRMVAKALGFSHALDVDVNRPLQDIGIDSLTAVQVRNRLAALTGLALSAGILFLYPSLKALSQFLLSRLQEVQNHNTPSLPTAATTKTSDSSYSLNMQSIRKGCLDSSFKFDETELQTTRNTSISRPRSVLLTGATGFVGAFILHELLKQNITTYCLVRAASTHEARKRIVETLEVYGLWESTNIPSLIRPIVGDISQPILGLTDQVFNDLAGSIDAICHAGALVDWMRPLEDYVGPNMISTHEILRLASRGRCSGSGLRSPTPVHLISTISTLSRYMGLDFNELEDQEYGYGTSKYMAERMVAAARWRGARASVYRLPYVTAASNTGRFRLDRGDFLHNFLSGCLEMGAFPVLEDGNGPAAVDMSAVLPVDYLSSTIVAIMTRDLDRVGRDYDFCNTATPKLKCNEFFRHMGSLSNGEIAVKEMMLPFETWKQKAMQYATANPAGNLARITAILDTYTVKTSATIFPSLPLGEHVLGGIGNYPAPPLDDQFIRGYLKRINSMKKEGDVK
ncbi:nonribosomal peptide synthetase 7 [Xylariales sp. PMI_506]|nr:nonribosomal peptide synthetase 7 [Xylariales sp. PMI_506]